MQLFWRNIRWTAKGLGHVPRPRNFHTISTANNLKGFSQTTKKPILRQGFVGHSTQYYTHSISLITMRKLFDSTKL